METGGQASISSALDKLWAQFLPQMRERVAIMDAANRALSAGDVSEDQRAAANAAAHKLAGVLGTFGLTKGTVLARKAEILYASDADYDEASIKRLNAIAAQLLGIIESRA